jgi:hypothetical protein
MLGCEIDVSVLINVEKNELVRQLIFQWKKGSTLVLDL